jgi:predicted nucleotidyltransferase
MLLQPSEQQALIADFKKAVSQLYGDRLAKIILYGSYARGDAHEESDIDFLVVLKDEVVNPYREIDRMNDSIFNLALKYNTMISFQPTSLQKLETSKMPIYYFIKKEGKEVWAN